LKRGDMKIIVSVFLSLLFASAAAAQDLPSTSLTRGTWDLGAFAGGGTGLGKSDDTQFFIAGGRVGRVLTGEHFSGWARGNFEWAIDLMPAYIVFPPTSAVYGGSFKPVIWQWNFTGGKKISPYAAVAGGVVFSRRNIPPGDTSTVNFTTQGVFGVHIFTRQSRALQLESAFGHLSSASLGNHNPGYNAFFTFTIGYTWYKTAR
jgi:lipid A 3-O-deacylase